MMFFISNKTHERIVSGKDFQIDILNYKIKKLKKEISEKDERIKLNNKIIDNLIIKLAQAGVKLSK